MITAELLVDLARRFLLRDDEAIGWRKDFPDGPTVDIETADRSFSIRVVRGWLRIEQVPWVEAVVVAQRDDQDLEGPPPNEVILVLGDGTAVHLNVPHAAAALATRLHRAELDAEAYAEVLVQCQWPGGWSKRLVLDPVRWRAEYPAEAPLPPVAAPRTWPDDGDLCLSFFASRESAEAVGGRSVLDVAEWSVRAPADAPATWQLRAVVAAAPLMPPWQPVVP
jgi:hypothetical protein